MKHHRITQDRTTKHRTTERRVLTTALMVIVVALVPACDLPGSSGAVSESKGSTDRSTATTQPTATTPPAPTPSIPQATLPPTSAPPATVPPTVPPTTVPAPAPTGASLPNDALELSLQFVRGVIAGDDVSRLASPEAISAVEQLASNPDDALPRGAGHTVSPADDHLMYSESGDVCSLLGDISGECLVVVTPPDGGYGAVYSVEYQGFREDDPVEYVDGMYLGPDGQPADPESFHPIVIGIYRVHG